MSSSVISDEQKIKIKELFENMNGSPATESASIAMDWLKKHNNFFAGFMDGSWISESQIVESNNETKPSKEVENLYDVVDLFTSQHLAKISVSSVDSLNVAAANSFKGFEKWLSINPQDRSELMYRIARNIEKYSQLFALVESLSSGKHLHKTKVKDVPNLIQTFYYDAGFAGLADKYKGWKPTGVICIVAEEYNNPLMSISWRVSSVIAAGNSALLLADMKSCLSAFLLAEICSMSGLPPGVLNVLAIDQEKLSALPKVSKIVFTGSSPKCKKYIEMASRLPVPCDVLVSKRPTVIVYENADYASAADGVLENLFFNDTRCASGGCKLLVQESAKRSFLTVMEKKFSSLLVGTNLSKTDMSCIITEEQRKFFSEKIKEGEHEVSTKKVQKIENKESCYERAKEEDCKELSEDDKQKREKLKKKEQKTQTEVLYGPDVNNASYLCWRPTAFFNMQTCSELVLKELGGPLILTISFRTVKESIAMFNCNKKGSDVSIWASQAALALEVAHKLKAGTVWVNSQNVFDAAAEYCGAQLGGNSNVLGKEAILSHSTICEYKHESEKVPDWESCDIKPARIMNLVETIGCHEESIIKHNYELFIGGTNKKPSSNEKMLVYDGGSNPYAYVACASSSDVHSAVLSASDVQPKWENITKYKHAQIFFSVAESLKKKKDEFINELSVISGFPLETCTKEVEMSVNRLFYWAYRVDKCDGQLKETSLYGKVLQEHNPLGVIGMQCPDQNPLLSFVSCVSPAIIFGNAVIVIASEKYPTLALKMCQIFQSCNIPGGVVNVISGCRDSLVQHLCSHLDIDAIWFDSGYEAAAYNSCSIRLKKIFKYKDVWNGVDEARSLKMELEATQTKTVYLPMGHIFAN